MIAWEKRHCTPEEYLRLERAADTRHEYYNGGIFDMAPIGCSMMVESLYEKVRFPPASELGIE